MTGKEKTPKKRSEPRWPVELAILALLYLLVELPGRIKLFPSWVLFAAGIVVLGPMFVAGLTGARHRWQLLERWITLVFVAVTGTFMVATLAFLVRAMVLQTVDLSGLQLLTSGIAVWVTVVLVFSLLYWQIDRGGPEGRMTDAITRPDWLFPQQGASAEDAPPGWRPSFVDYLFLGFSTATAFSTTDVIPLTSRAKMLMMLESTISLVTIVMVASRAINILGS